MAEFARLKPGSSTAIQRIQQPHGTQATTTEDKLSCLSKHWADIFEAEEFDGDAAEAWLKKAYPDGEFLGSSPKLDPER